jgi:hypothetical protein
VRALREIEHCSVHTADVPQHEKLKLFAIVGPRPAQEPLRNNASGLAAWSLRSIQRLPLDFRPRHTVGRRQDCAVHTDRNVGLSRPADIGQVVARGRFPARPVHAIGRRSDSSARADRDELAARPRQSGDRATSRPRRLPYGSVRRTKKRPVLADRRELAAGPDVAGRCSSATCASSNSHDPVRSRSRRCSRRRRTARRSTPRRRVRSSRPTSAPSTWCRSARSAPCRPPPQLRTTSPTTQPSSAGRCSPPSGVGWNRRRGTMSERRFPAAILFLCRAEFARCSTFRQELLVP